MGIREDGIISENYVVMGRKTTICLLTVCNGFEIVGTSACVNPEDFNAELGRKYAREDAENKYQQFCAFLAQDEAAKLQYAMEQNKKDKQDLAKAEYSEGDDHSMFCQCGCKD